jgi:hypothetical protein
MVVMDYEKSIAKEQISSTNCDLWYRIKIILHLPNHLINNFQNNIKS